MTPELRHMLRDDDLNHEEQKQVLELAIKFHHDRFYKQPFAGPQAVAVLFDKPSTRTRSSFSIGVAELGGYPLVIDKSGSQLGRGEPVADTARVLNRMAYGVVWRTFGQGRVEEMAKYSTHPVVNALTDDFHPCQILADFQTIAEHRGGVDNLKNQTIACARTACMFAWNRRWRCVRMTILAMTSVIRRLNAAWAARRSTRIVPIW